MATHVVAQDNTHLLLTVLEGRNPTGPTGWPRGVGGAAPSPEMGSVCSLDLPATGLPAFLDSWLAPASASTATSPALPLTLRPPRKNTRDYVAPTRVV